VTILGLLRSEPADARVTSGRSVGAHRAVDCGPADGLLTTGRAVVMFGDAEVLVGGTQRGIFALENRCPHMGRAFTDARISRRALVRTGHSQAFDLASGRAAGGMTGRAPVQAFDVAVDNGRLWLSPKQKR
jgi:nitrite reductase/ring-hydroxylating ferredoxin subunit